MTQTHVQPRIPRERFWSLVEQSRRDLSAAARTMTPDELAGYERWHVHYSMGLMSRVTIGAVASLCLDAWPEHDDHQLEVFVNWLIQQGEVVLEAAVRDPDSVAACTWDGAPARVGDGELLYETAISRGVDLSNPEAYPLLGSPPWPADRSESWGELVTPPRLYQLFPRLVARLEIERLRFTMPRATWQREAQQRNRWWGLAWDALETREHAYELPRFWRVVELIAWPAQNEVAPFEAFGMPERVRFALRFHERLATLERAVAAHEVTHGPLVTTDREERLASVIAAGRSSYDAVLANVDSLRQPSTSVLGFAAYVDELRRAPATDLLRLLPMETSDRADQLLAGAIVVDHDLGYGFVAASSPGASPDHIIYLDATVPITR